MSQDATTSATRRSPLTVATEIVVIVAAVVLTGRAARDALRPPPPPPPAPKIGGMAFTSHANNQVAHFGFTNLTPDVRIACMKGIVTAIQSRVSIESQIVCTGEVKPSSTVSVDASWPKGSPDDICYKESSFGKTLDWSKCEYTSQAVDPVLPQAGGAGPIAVAAGSASAR